MEILQLRYFLESAKEENFTRAAVRFGVPVTSVSASVRRLERELGHDLFDRRANRIALNSRGRRLYSALSLGMADLDAALEDAAQEESGETEIRLLVRAMRRRVTSAIVAFRRRVPGARFRVVFDQGATDPGEYDVIVDSDFGRYPDRERFSWYDTPLCLTTFADDPLCKKKLLLADLKDRDFLSMGPESNTHRILVRSCESAGFLPRFSVFCNDVECYEKLVADGVGIGVMRAEAVPGIRSLVVADFCERYAVYVYARKAASDVVRRFIRFLRDGAVTE